VNTDAASIASNNLTQPLQESSLNNQKQYAEL